MDGRQKDRPRRLCPSSAETASAEILCDAFQSEPEHQSRRERRGTCTSSELQPALEKMNVVGLHDGAMPPFRVRPRRDKSADERASVSDFIGALVHPCPNLRVWRVDEYARRRPRLG